MRSKSNIPVIIGGAAVGATIGLVLPEDTLDQSSKLLHSGKQILSTQGLYPGCVIKGNISINNGQKIYHIPGQKYYSVTGIRPDHGERWFCSEQEAQQAGWRKAKL